ncbi:MAG: hypothetical protein CMN30_22385 [Sandaracinus sp.]|nr:hypothetical protein [Sandaracinus sp.]
MRQTSTLFGTLAFLCWGGCAPDLPPLQLSTEHVDYYSYDDRSATSEAFAAELDARFEAFRDFLGVDPGRVRYYHLSDSSTLAHYCYAPDPPQFSGCEYDGQIYARRALMVHELVHAFGEALGNPPRVFSEGLAEVLSGYSGGHLPKEDGIRDLLDDDFFRGGAQPTRNHGQAMSLTAFLVDEYGWPFVLRLHREIPFGAARAGEWLERMTAMSLEELTRRWQESPAGVYVGSASVHPYECGEGIPLLDLARGSEARLEVASGVGGDLDRWRARARVRVEEPQWFRWSSPQEARVAVRGCGVASAHSLPLRGRSQWSALPPGDHAVLVGAAEGEMGPVDLAWEPVAAPIASVCGDAPLNVLEPEGLHVQLSLATGLASLSCGPEECVGWVRLATEDEVIVEGTVLSIERPSGSEVVRFVRRVETCGDCARGCRVAEPTTEGFRALVLAPVDGEILARLTLDRALLSSSASLTFRPRS